MGAYLSLFMLAAAVSLDSFSAGLAYGFKKLKLPIKSSVILSLCSAGSLLAAMGTGHLISKLMNPSIAEHIGGVILILLGIWVLWQFFHQHEENKEAKKEIIHFEIKRLGLVIQILKRPVDADLDNSGTISGVEALLLGFALSLDSFGAGIGAGMLGYSPLLLAGAVGTMNLIFVSAGLSCGRLFANTKWVQRVAFFPGVLLIILGLFKF